MGIRWPFLIACMAIVASTPICGKEASPKNIVARVDEVSDRQSDIDNKIIVVSTKLEGVEKSTDRIEMLIGLFGVLMTILVLFFTIKTERSAIRSAANTAHEAIKAQQGEVEACVTTARAHAQSASATLDEIRSIRISAVKLHDDLQNTVGQTHD